MTVNTEDAWNFCYSLPVKPGTPLDEIQIVIPHSLQMGWCESPPFFVQQQKHEETSYTTLSMT
jgi:hypothetical protein